MTRREMLISSPAAMAAAAYGLSETAEAQTPAPPFQGVKSGLKITGVRLVTTRSRRPPAPRFTPAPGSWSASTAEIANPMSIYPKYKTRRPLFMADKVPSRWRS